MNVFRARIIYYPSGEPKGKFYSTSQLVEGENIFAATEKAKEPWVSNGWLIFDFSIRLVGESLTVKIGTPK